MPLMDVRSGIRQIIINYCPSNIQHCRNQYIGCEFEISYITTMTVICFTLSNGIQ
jgi:hypothetical protein